MEVVMDLETKTFFLVRHGESSWNNAKKYLNITRLLMYRDHALTSKGVQQAADLNAHWKIDNTEETESLYRYRQKFVDADRIFSSPFTRAIQTTVISLEGHKALANGITLKKCLRENKMAFCYDAAGKKCGSQIVERVKRKLAQQLGQERAEELMSTDINYAEAIDEWSPSWWSGTEKGEDIQLRVKEFLNFVRTCDAETPIIVGHSQFFRAFYSSHISTTLSQTQPELSANMRKHRLGNGSVLAVTVSYRNAEPEIVDAAVLFEGNEPQWVH